jgi:hypothetical protein
MRFRYIVALLSPIALLLLLIASECAYRFLIWRQCVSLEREVKQRHSGWVYDGARYTRFGNETESLEVSLVADVNAYLRRFTSQPSPLDTDGCCSSHAYMTVNFSLDDNKQMINHVFIWSPRKFRFVHWANWGASCDEKLCPWIHDPGYPLRTSPAR